MRVTRLVAVGCAVYAAIMAMAFGATPARADFGFKPNGVSVSLSTTQAGAHPDITTSFAMNSDADGNLEGTTRQLSVSLPPGIVGNSTAVAQCSQRVLLYPVGSGGGSCPAAAQVGTMTLDLALGPFFTPFSGPLYNLVPRAGVPAQFGANLTALNAILVITVRPDDYGLTVTTTVPEGTLSLGDGTVTLWGIPADHVGSGLPRLPFLTNPATCGEPSAASFSADSWEHAGNVVVATAPIPPFTGCDSLPRVDPAATIGPARAAVGGPSGYDIDLTVPQHDDPDGLATPSVRKVSIEFPEGVAISPPSGEGLQSCDEADVAIGSSSDAQCPAGSKVGTVSIRTPLLADALTGALYVGKHRNHEFQLFLVAQGSGVTVKLPGVARPDPNTGQLTTTFDNAPQLPFSDLRVHLKGGPRALLVNPQNCGTFTSTVTLTPFGGGSEGVAPSSFDVSGDGQGQRCPSSRGFATELTAGAANPAAGATSDFVFRLTRGDREQDISTIDATLPKGMLAKIAGVPLCGDGDAGSGICPDATRIGATSVGVGSGSSPLFLPGSVYLTGPYKGAPYGLSIVVPANVGPFSFGNVVVRAAIYVDPITAALRVLSDPLPQILEGIPLHYRDVRLSIDRSGFMRNPTSCEPAAVTSSIVSTSGTVAPVSSRFQVGDCAALPFAPRLAMALKGSSQTRDGTHPTLEATLTQRPGQANLKKVAVTLPLSLALDVNNAQGLCSYDAGQRVDCPASSIVGHAEAITPLLNRPLTAPVYFVEGKRTDPKTGRQVATLPTLLIPLRGELGIDLRAGTQVEDGRIITTFDNIPDAPISRFFLHLDGGTHGILVVSNADVCKATQEADHEMGAQSGKAADGSVVVSTPCGLKALSRQLSSRAVTVTVGGLGAGKLTVAGAGIRTTSRTIRSASVATIVAHLTRQGQHRRPTRATLTFDPAGPAKATRTTVSLPRSRT